MFLLSTTARQRSSDVRTVLHDTREALDPEVAQDLVHAAVMVEVAMGDDRQGDPLDLHLVHQRRLLRVGAGVDHDPLLVRGSDQDPVRLPAIEHLDADGAVLGLSGERENESDGESQEELAHGSLLVPASYTRGVKFKRAIEVRQPPVMTTPRGISGSSDRRRPE